MTHKDKDLHRIEELIDVMNKNNLVEIEIQHGDDKIMLKRSQPQPPVVTSVPMTPAISANQGSKTEQAAIPESKESDNLIEITSPIVGTFYATPSPDSEAYVEIGSKVESQTIVCIIEAMKVMNEIKAEVSGTIAEILVTSGQAVEYGQVLFKVKPD